MFKLGLGRISGLAVYPAGYRILKVQAGYPVFSDIQPYFTEVIRPDIRQFSLLYQN